MGGGARVHKARSTLKKNASCGVIQKMSILQMVQDAFERYEGEDVTRKRRQMEKEDELSFDDLPQFAQRTLLQQEIEINYLKLEAQKTTIQLASLRADLARAQRNIQHLNNVVSALGGIQILNQK